MSKPEREAAATGTSDGAPGSPPSRPTLPLATDWSLASFDSSPIGMAVTAPAGHLIRVNRAFSSMLGYTLDELGDSDWKSLTHPDDVDASWEMVRRLVDGPSSSGRIEKRYLARDGHVVWADVSTSLLRDGEGKALYLVTHVVDVTARRGAEEERQRAAAEILDLYDNAPCGYHSLGADGTFLRINATELAWLGYAREEIVGKKNITDILTPESVELFRAEFSGFKERGWVKDLLLDMVRRDGSHLHITVNATAIHDADGAYLMSRSTVFEDTLHREATRELQEHRDHLEALVAARTAELRRTAEELSRSNRDLEQFAYVASHDLQQPLRMVASFVERLAEDYRGKLDGDADTYIRIASENARQMQRLIQDLLSFARVGDRGGGFAPTDTSRCLDEALEELQETIARIGAEVSRGPLPTVLGDARQLVTLFRHLVGNALEYHRGVPPLVRIGARREGGEWLFSVEDNGVGIERRYFDRVFRIFQRLHAPAAHIGTGIGLAVCKKIVEGHGGRIWIESEPGQGTTILFTLPDREEGAA
ncbi:MAG: PAS domain S-box protein [Holophagales bacterium]|nr:PAS domain S-box protein [Holophagales bacterium]